MRYCTDNEIRRLRMRSQRLTGMRLRRVSDVVRGVAALPAQDTRAARLAVRPRSQGLSVSAVNRACNEDRSVVRTWAMRGTLHMLPAEDVAWIVGLLGPIFAAADRRRRLHLGLDDELCARALPAIRTILTDAGPLTRAELVRSLAGRRVSVEAKSQAPAHLLFYAAMQGLICRGPDREDDEPTYVLLDDWLGIQPQRERDAALAELARQYLGAYGPAEVSDFAYWAGIALSQARKGFQLIERELEEVRVLGRQAWMVASAAGLGSFRRDGSEPAVRLLGAFDPYLLGYRSRTLALDPRFARRIQAGGGRIHPAVILDGRVIGTWRLHHKGREVTISVEPFQRLGRAVRDALAVEASDIGRFLAATSRLVVEP